MVLFMYIAHIQISIETILLRRAIFWSILNIYFLLPVLSVHCVYEITLEINLLFHHYCLNKRKVTGDKMETEVSFIGPHRANPSIFSVDYVCHIVSLRLDVDQRLANMHTVGCTCIQHNVNMTCYLSGIYARVFLAYMNLDKLLIIDLFTQYLTKSVERGELLLHRKSRTNNCN